VLAAVVGTLVGLGLVAALVGTGVLSSSSSSTSDDAVDQFLAAYRRSKETTYVVEAQFTRTMDDGRQLASAAAVAQRPPDELRRQLGSITGRLRDQRVNCSTLPSGAFRCAPGGPVDPWNEVVDREVDALAGYLRNEPALYALTRADEGCFELDALYYRSDAPYGSGARMCFDAATGAMRLLEVRREGGAVDRFEAVQIRTAVTDADFVVEQDDTFAVAPGG
jgi:hypothetical protein